MDNLKITWSASLHALFSQVKPSSSELLLLAMQQNCRDWERFSRPMIHPAFAQWAEDEPERFGLPPKIGA